MSHNRILIAVDFSTESREALDYMLTFANSSRDELVLLSVVETYRGVFNMLKVDFDTQILTEANESLIKETKTMLATYAVKCEHSGFHPMTICAEGSPRDKILETANDLKCTMIVTGCRGRGPLTNAVMGSVSQHIVQYAKVPVLVYRPTPKQQ